MNSAGMARVNDDAADAEADAADADADAADDAAADDDAVDADAADADAGDATLDEGAECEWVQAHRALSRLARQRARMDAEEGRWLLKARRSAAHLHMGFGSFAEYVERCFGYCARSTHEKLRVAEALEHLPVLARALESGTLCWSALRELTRVATPETESAWLEVARGKLSRELEPLVAGARPGDLPNAARSPEARRHVLRFEVTAETYATFRESTVQLRRASDASLDDDAILLAMARAVLGGPRDDGRASYQVSLCVCPECGRGTQAAGGASVPVGPAIVAMAACDAQQIGHVSEAAHVGATAAARDATLDDGIALDDGSPAAAEAGVSAAVASNLMRTAHESAADVANDRTRSADAAIDEAMALNRGAPAHGDRSASSAPSAHTGTRAMKIMPARDATVAPHEAMALDREASVHPDSSASSAPRAHTGTRQTQTIAAPVAAVAPHEAAAPDREAPTQPNRLASSAPRHAHTGTRVMTTRPGRDAAVAFDEAVALDRQASVHADPSASRHAHTGTREMQTIPMPARDAAVAFDEAVALDREASVHADPSASSAPRAHTGTRETQTIAAPIAAVAPHETGALDREAPAHADRLGSNAPRHAHTGTRATQTIPPALRRRVLARDHHRCRVPGCQNSAYLDLHHLRPRAEGGPNTAANLIPLCGAHHRGVHAGALVIEGQSAESLRFYHADGTPYGQPADPHALDVQAKVFSGLRNLGFRESEARAVLDQLRRDPALASLGVRELMRAALERIALPGRGHCTGFR